MPGHGALRATTCDVPPVCTSVAVTLIRRTKLGVSTVEDGAVVGPASETIARRYLP